MTFVSSFPREHAIKKIVVAVLLSLSAASIYASGNTLMGAGLIDVETALQNHDLVQARSMAEGLVKSMPGNPKLHYYLAQIYAEQGEWAPAKRMLDKAKYFDWQWKFASSKDKVIALDTYIGTHLPSTSLTSSVKVVPLSSSLTEVENALREHNTDKALTLAQALVKKTPGDAKLHYYLAQIYADKARWDDAKRMLSKAKYFDWQWKFASSKDKVVALDSYIQLHSAGPSSNTANPEELYRIFRKIERVTRESLMHVEPEPITVSDIVVEDLSRHTFVWIFSIVVFSLGVIVVFMVRRFNKDRLRLELRRTHAELREKKMVLVDLERLIEDIKFTADVEKLMALFHAVEKLQLQISSILTDEQGVKNSTVADIESLVSLTKLYKHHSENLIDLH